MTSDRLDDHALCAIEMANALRASTGGDPRVVAAIDALTATVRRAWKEQHEGSLRNVGAVFACRMLLAGVDHDDERAFHTGLHLARRAVEQRRDAVLRVEAVLHAAAAYVDATAGGEVSSVETVPSRFTALRNAVERLRGAGSTTTRSSRWLAPSPDRCPRCR